MKKLFLVYLIFIFSSAIHAQQPAANAPFKIAALNMDSLLTIMPAYKEATTKAQDYYDKLASRLSDMQNQLNEMYKEKHPSALQKSKIAEKEQEIIDFKNTADTDYSNHRTDLYKPIFEDILKASQKVAAREGYAFVIDSSKSSALVLFAADSYSIFNDVCKELGIPGY